MSQHVSTDYFLLTRSIIRKKARALLRIVPSSVIIALAKCGTPDDSPLFDQQVGVSRKRGFLETPQARGNPILTPKTSTAIQSRRIRVGDYRIRYDLEGEEVLLYRVRHRRDMYPD